MLKYLASDLTAHGDTTKTLIDTIVLPANSKAILGVWAYVEGGAAMTTAEPISGILELESPDKNLQPCQIPLDITNVLTSGSVTRNVKVWPLNAAVGGSNRISGYITLDLAQTGAQKARFGLVVDVAQ